MTAATYDAGALIAAERGDRALWRFHTALLTQGHRPVVPVGVLAQAWRGGPQSRLSRLLRGCSVEPLTEPMARAAGRALAASGTNDVVDATVVLTAAMGRRVVVTSDRDDLQRVADAIGCEILWKTV
jgi:hypothetical protein